MRQLAKYVGTQRRDTYILLSLVLAVELMACWTVAFLPTSVFPWNSPRSQQRQERSETSQGRRQKQQPRIHSASSSLLQRFGSASKTGGTLIVSNEAFAAALAASADRPLLVFFTAPWCGPCRLSVPVVKDVMKLFSGQIDCCEICTDDLPDVTSDSGVVSIPTIHLYSNGR